MRPKIIAGDLIRLSKNGKVRAPYYVPKNCQMIVLEVDGDGIDRTTKLTCCLGKEKYLFARNEVWKTGFNVFDSELPNEIILDQDAPLNNDGRGTCYVCYMPTKIIGAIKIYNVCKNTNCKWYEN